MNETGPRARILIVEDESIVSRVIALGLERLGYEVAGTLSSGESAIEKIAEIQPDLILMDIQLNGAIDGIEASRKIHEKFNVPIIFLTAYADTATIERVKEAEAFGYLLKPVERNELHTTIEVALRKHKSIQEQQATAKEALDRSEKLFKLFVESVKDCAIYMLDPGGHITTWNLGAERIKNYRADEVLGKHFSIFSPQEDIALGKPEQQLNAAKMEGRFEEEGWRIRKDGSRFWASVVITALRDEGGRLQGFGEVTRDITSLRNQQKWLEATLDLMPTPLVLFAPESRKVIFANQAADKMAGGSFLENSANSDSRAAYYCTDAEGNRIPDNELPLARTSRGERLTGSQMNWHTPSGGRPVVVYSNLLPEMHGHPATAVIAFNDISQLKETESRLQNAIRAKDEFLSIASHELKTPLTIIMAYAQAINRQREKNNDSFFSAATMVPIAKEIDKQVSRLARLVNDILDVSRVSSGHFTMSPRQIDFSSVVHDVVAQLSPQFRAAGCEVSVNTQVSTQGFWDRYRIEQVVINLLTNAMNYGKGKPIEIEAKEQGDHVTLQIRDHGIGIAKEDSQRIFRRFERAVSKNEVSGLGLGLYIAEQILAAHGGNIQLKSELGKGATFTVNLPFRIGEEIHAARKVDTRHR